MKTYVNVSFLIILIFQRFDFIIQRFDGKRSKQKRKINFLVLPIGLHSISVHTIGVHTLGIKTKVLLNAMQ